MPSRLERLHDLETRYNGPIPVSERDAVLYATSPVHRVTLNRIRTHRRWVSQAIAASRQWRAIAAQGGHDHLIPLSDLRHRNDLVCSLVHATGQLVNWQTYALANGCKLGNRNRDSARQRNLPT